jgi:hypothetical protein
VAQAEGWRAAMIERVQAEGGWHYRVLATGYDAKTTAPRSLTALLIETALAEPGSSPAARRPGLRHLDTSVTNRFCNTIDVFAVPSHVYLMDRS